MRICVCGGREYDDYDRVCRALDTAVMAFGDDITIITGDARGADSLGNRWATDRGKQLIKVPADWNKHKNSAGPIRNRAMLKLGFDLLVAFPGGSGTNDMISITKKAGIPVRIIK